MKTYQTPKDGRLTKSWMLTDGPADELHIMHLDYHGFTLSVLNISKKKAWGPEMSLLSLRKCEFITEEHQTPYWERRRM